MWSIIEGDPGNRGQALEPDFFNSLMSLENRNDSSNDENLNDSGVDFTPIKLQGPSGEVSLNWVTELLNWAVEEDEKEDKENGQEDIQFVLMLEKAFSCKFEACTEHVQWSARVYKTQGLKTFADLENDDLGAELLDGWIRTFKYKHFPSVLRMDLITTIFGRGSRPSDI